MISLTKTILVGAVAMGINMAQAHAMECYSVGGAINGAIRIHHFQTPDPAKPNELTAMLSPKNGVAAELKCVRTVKSQFSSTLSCIGRTMLQSIIVRTRIDQVSEKTIQGISTSILGVATYSGNSGIDLVSINSAIPFQCK